MPIRPELRHHYGLTWKNSTRPRILARAGNRCEECAASNGAIVLRSHGWWTLSPNAARFMSWDHDMTLEWHGPGQRTRVTWIDKLGCHWVKIVLTVAHLNHVAGDDRDDNLSALCQWCHLQHDRQHHKETRAARKDQGRALLVFIDKARSS
jgi:hypothetical protein